MKLGTVRIENFVLQTLREVVKENGPDLVKNFEEKFKEIRVEGRRKSVPSAMYTEMLPTTYYTEAELEAMYMGTESEARKRFQRNNSFSKKRQFSDGRQISLSRGSRYGSSKSRYEKFSSGGKDSSMKHDRS